MSLVECVPNFSEGRRPDVIERIRDAIRRVVVTRIAKKGLDLVNSLDAPVNAALRRQLGHVGKEKLTQLIDILESLRYEPE